MTGLVVGPFAGTDVDNGKKLNRWIACAIVSCGLLACVSPAVSMSGPHGNRVAAQAAGPGPVEIVPQRSDSTTGSSERIRASDSWPRLAAKGDTGTQAEPAKRGLGGVLSEVRLGGFVHDTGPASTNKEDGFDINLELLFVSPRFMEVVFAPRPHVGVTINTVGDTSLAYIGLSWEWTFWDNWFAGISGGGSIHNGELSTSRSDKKELGCRLLFRTSVEAGYRFAGRHSVSGVWTHNSNANICDHNEGLENVGIRYGYKF